MSNSIRFARGSDNHGGHEVVAHPPVRRWLDALAARFPHADVTIHAARFFSPHAGFVLAEAEMRDQDGRPVPGVALLRGDSVAILPVLIPPDGVARTVVVRQARVPVGDPDYAEIPAGMQDGADVRSRAISELVEEVGPEIAPDPGSLHTLETVHMSPGGCDETVTILSYTRRISAETLARIDGRRSGNPDESESIRVEVVLLADLGRIAAADAKSRLALLSYLARENGLI